jgi:D-3-phosphoglycerate dehydrogenase
LKAFVTAQLTAEGIQRLSQRLSLTFGGWGYEGVKLTPAQLAESARECEILIVGYEDINEHVLKNLPQLRYIACARGGIENVDVEMVKAYGVTLSNAPGRNASAVAELTIGLMISIARFIPQTHRLIMERRWEEVPWDIAGNTPSKRFAGVDLEGKTLGIIGFGAIGRKVARRASGFDMDLKVYDPFAGLGEFEGVAESVDLDTLFTRSDFISLHCKLTNETRDIIDKRNLVKMKENAYLINTARGDLVNEEDLFEALKRGEIAGAALDVLVEEPIDRNHPFLGLDNLIITPHIGGASHDILYSQTDIIVQDVLDYLDGKRPVHAVV